MKHSVVYVTYDGLLEPLGQSQVLAYLEKLSDQYNILIISFEKRRDYENADRVSTLRKRLVESSLEWKPFIYHKSPSVAATAWDILVGMIAVQRACMTRKVSILHARSYVPALMMMPAKRLAKPKFIFDIRGFWADERVDGGLWPRDGGLYKVTKRLERFFFRSSDQIVTLTRASEKIIREFDYLQDAPKPIAVIPTCADLDRFKPAPGDPGRPFTFGYVGSIGTWYMFDETMALFREITKLEPEARFIVVNRNEHDAVWKAAEKHGVDRRHLEVVSAEHRDVPSKVSQMHAAAALIRPSFSKLSSAPTKLAEYLGCGVPCVGNVGVGDMEEILNGQRVGVVLRDFSAGEIARSARDVVSLSRQPDVGQRCRHVAENLFSLSSGVQAYRSIYERLVSGAS